MNLVDVRVFREERCSIEKDLESGKYYLSFPVFNGMVDYTEYYEIPSNDLNSILNDEKSRKQLLDKSRSRQNDDHLLFKPGKMRGSPC